MLGQFLINIYDELKLYDEILLVTAHPWVPHNKVMCHQKGVSPSGPPQQGYVTGNTVGTERAIIKRTHNLQLIIVFLKHLVISVYPSHLKSSQVIASYLASRD
jgi:hypothetical protein